MKEPLQKLGVGMYRVTGRIQCIGSHEVEAVFDEPTHYSEWDGVISGESADGNACGILFAGKIEEFTLAEDCVRAVMQLGTLTPVLHDQVTMVYSKDDQHLVVVADWRQLNP